MIETSNEIADTLFDDLRNKGFIPEEDIAWVAVTAKFLDGLDGLSFICSLRQVKCKIYKGVEFRVSQWANNESLNNLTGKFAWNITKRTRQLFDWK